MSAQPFSLDSRVALVTGSTAGIGRAIAASLSGAGARVVVNGRDPQRADAVAATLDGSFAMPFDVNDHAAAEAALDRIVGLCGRLDIVVCTVGERDRRKISEITPDELAGLLATNTVSAYQMARAAVSRMSNPETGRLIFVSSVASTRPFRGDPAYAASKAAMDSLVRSFCYEYAHLGITANAIAPGFVLTEFNAGLASEATIREFVQSRIPARRWARPEEIANVAVFLASDAASYVNGHVLTVDAGMSVNL